MTESTLHISSPGRSDRKYLVTELYNRYVRQTSLLLYKNSETFFFINRICLDFTVHDQPMEEEKVVDDIKAKSCSPLPTGLPINWGLITGPVPEPVFPASSLGTSLPPPQSSAVHALQTKVRSLTQRRTRGRDREKEREKLNAEVLLNSPAGQISSEVLLRQRPRGKGPVSLPATSWRSAAAKNLSSSDEEEEVEVQVRLEIHSPPAEAQGQQVFQGELETEEEKSERNEGQVSSLTGQPCGLGEGTSLESLLSDHSSSSKDEPSPLPPPPVLSLSSASSSTSTTSSSTSTTTTRHWAPPKGFWRVARPETLLLNGVGPNTTSTLPSKEYNQTEALAEPQMKSKPAAEAGTRSTVGSVVDDSDASSEFKHSDSVECYLDRYEQKETGVTDPVKGLCSSDSWESTSSQSGLLSADEKLKVKQRAYAKLRERQQNCREEREQSGDESASQHGDSTYRVDCKGKPPEGNCMYLMSHFKITICVKIEWKHK